MSCLLLWLNPTCGRPPCIRQADAWTTPCYDTPELELERHVGGVCPGLSDCKWCCITLADTRHCPLGNEAVVQHVQGWGLLGVAAVQLHCPNNEFTASLLSLL